MKRVYLFDNYKKLVRNGLIYNQKNEAILYLSGRINSINKPKLAIKNIEKAIELSTYKNFWFYKDLIDIQINIGKFKEASKTIEKAKTIFGSNSKLHTLSGKILYKLNKINPALNEFAQAEKMDSRNIEPLYNISMILANNGNIKQAKKVIARAIKIAPLKYILINNYAIMLAQTGEIDSAIKKAKFTLKLLENDLKVINKKNKNKVYLYSVALNNYSAILQKAGNLEKAKSIMKNSSKIFSSSIEKGGLNKDIFAKNLDNIENLNKDINMIYFQID
jgi:tetratricopeptide (TPR) repeat protein